MKTESDIKKEIAAYLDSLGERCYHFPFHNVGYARKGIQDQIVCYRGRFFAIEAKRDADAKETKWQERERKAVLAAGGHAIVAWSVEQVRAAIEEIDRAIKYEWWLSAI